MDIIKHIAQRLIIPIYDWKYGIKYKDILSGLNKSQFYSPERIREYQWNKLKAIIDFAYNNNSFYKNKYEKSGIHPDDIKNWDDFTKVPILTKDDLRNNLNDLISDNYKIDNMTHKRTGGSTGIPVHLYIDHDAMNFKRAATFRHNSWANYYPGMKRAALWGDTDKEYSFKEKIYNRLYVRTIFLDTLKMDDEYILEFIDNIRKYRPESLIGHGHSLFYFAQFIKDNNIDDIRFRGIISTAETLTEDERGIIEDVFGNIVFDRYGCEELSIIASECDAHDGLHINAEGLFVESDSENPDTPGELIITDLVNRGMPFIRYSIGDIGSIVESQCKCGRGLPRLSKIMGRTSDILVTPEGRKISGISILDTFIIHISGFRQVQIIQNEINHLNFNIIRDNNFDDSSLTALKNAVIDIFGPNMNYSIEYVDNIPMTSRGKFQFTICNLKDYR